MNNLNARRKENGVGLIEILIVLVVLVIGWAAIAALQGKLISGSSASKARNEALGLAREKTEELRNSIEKGQYVSDLSNTSADEIEGVNATFERSWLLGDYYSPDGIAIAVGSLKEVIVKVSWTNNEGGTEDVVLNSIIAFSDALKMASLLTGGSGDVGRLASPNAQTAIEGPVSEGIEIDLGTLDEEGDPDTLLDDIYTSVDEYGNLVVYQGNATAANVELTVFGGKILKFSGLIYYDSSDPFVRATSPSYCTTFTQTQEDCGISHPGSKIECARYVCYAGGDCSNGGDGCPGDVNLPANLNGGWQGKIGNFFPSLANPQKFPVICMGDSDDVAARLFYSKRELETGGYEREGINTSFECYDTLISTEKPAGCTKLINELTGYGIKIDPDADPDEIADHQIIRPLTVNDTNMVLAATNTSYSNGVFPNFCPPPP